MKNTIKKEWINPEMVDLDTDQTTNTPGAVTDDGDPDTASNS